MTGSLRGGLNLASESKGRPRMVGKRLELNEKGKRKRLGLSGETDCEIRCRREEGERLWLAG